MQSCIGPVFTEITGHFLPSCHSGADEEAASIAQLSPGLVCLTAAYMQTAISLSDHPLIKDCVVAPSK